MVIMVHQWSNWESLFWNPEIGCPIQNNYIVFKLYSVSSWILLTEAASLFFLNILHLVYVWRNVFYSRDIKPFWRTFCFSCHGESQFQRSGNAPEFVDLPVWEKHVCWFTDFLHFDEWQESRHTGSVKFQSWILNNPAALHGQAIMSPRLNIWSTFGMVHILYNVLNRIEWTGIE